MVEASHEESIARWLAEAETAVVFTGAGISTESGIPDFRSPGGVWTRFRTVYYDEFMAREDARREYWRQKTLAHQEFSVAEPNAGHLAVAGWEEAGHIQAVVTQNIDGLHQLAGSRTVLELHGTAREVQCQDCAARVPAGPLVDAYSADETLPICAQCGGQRMKHATISFGQSLPERVLEEAMERCAAADLLLAIGSSLVVQPAASLPLLAKQGGGRVVIINRDPTPLDDAADLVVQQPIGVTLTKVEEARQRLR